MIFCELDEAILECLTKKKTFKRFPNGAFHLNAQRIGGIVTYFMGRLSRGSLPRKFVLALEHADQVETPTSSLTDRWKDFCNKDANQVKFKEKLGGKLSEMAKNVAGFFLAKENRDESAEFPCYGSENRCPYEAKVTICDGDAAHDEPRASQFSRRPTYYLCHQCNLGQSNNPLKGNASIVSRALAPPPPPPDTQSLARILNAMASRHLNPVKKLSPKCHRNTSAKCTSTDAASNTASTEFHDAASAERHGAVSVEVHLVSLAKVGFLTLWKSDGSDALSAALASIIWSCPESFPQRFFIRVHNAFERY